MRFRQIRESSNDIRMEITPTHVNIPTSLRMGGYTVGLRPFVTCAVPGGTDGVCWPRGQNAASCTRESLGVYLVSWPVAHPDGAQYVPQCSRLIVAICSAERTSTSIRIRTASDGTGTIADRDLSFTLL